MPVPPPDPSAPLVIRRAREDELAVVGDLTVDAYVGAGVIPSDAAYLEFLRDAAHRHREAEVWVALDGDRVIGTVTYVEPGSALVEVSREGEAEMRSLAVDPSAAGRGVGVALARHVIERARERGFDAVVLCSSTTMHVAHRLYERLGFTRIPERDWQPVPEVHLLAYTLPLHD
ncbi:GNAT family N-acetyltransferase [Oryzobacter telluris]|uniref:GNAT family N-acetyltransferase n=1 Tax=Oryzobacter telluris TaxID=3149179 RepID=UPI00370D5763